MGGSSFGRSVTSVMMVGQDRAISVVVEEVLYMDRQLDEKCDAEHWQGAYGVYCFTEIYTLTIPVPDVSEPPIRTSFLGEERRKGQLLSALNMGIT